MPEFKARQSKNRGSRGSHDRPRRRRGEKSSPLLQEFDQKVLDIARVARVTAGGRRFNFRVVMVIGDRNGRVGVGVNKGKDVAMAMEKAATTARRNIITVPITKEGTIPFEVSAKHTSAVVLLRPARKGRGIIAGGAMRAVCDLVGLKDITAKMIGRSNNKLNNATATIMALQKISGIAVRPLSKIPSSSTTLTVNAVPLRGEHTLRVLAASNGASEGPKVLNEVGVKPLEDSEQPVMSEVAPKVPSIVEGPKSKTKSKKDGKSKVGSTEAIPAEAPAVQIISKIPSAVEGPEIQK